jgi:hypothetical protein
MLCPLLHSCRSSRTLSLVGALALAATIAPLGPPVSAQPLPVNRLAYSAKFMCGRETLDDLRSMVPLGTEFTLIEVHNPHSTAVTCSVKVVRDYPPPVGITTPQYPVTIPANGTLFFDCATLAPLAQPATFVAMGFLEIVAPRQIKVVAIYKEAMGYGSLIKSVGIAKKSSPGFIILGQIRHSATLLVGDEATASMDTIRHETTVSIANMSPSVVNANISIVSKAGLVTSFPHTFLPNGFMTVTGADLPPGTPMPFVGGVTVQYPDVGFGVLLECEEIIQKYAISGTASVAMGMSVVEVQPIPLR